MKYCIKCYQGKELTEFHKNKPSCDGHLNICKTCSNKYHKNYRQTEKGRAYFKRYRQSEKGRIARRIAHRIGDKRYSNLYPERRKARKAISNAIHAGRLPRPDTLQCHYCPAQAKEYHHHKGYEPEYWLDVVPVCIQCHQKCKKKIA